MLLLATWLLLLSTSSKILAQNPPTDRLCGNDLSNLWLDVVVVVDNSIGMTQAGLTEVLFCLSVCPDVCIFDSNNLVSWEIYQEVIN
ncbi:hypothetical protein B9Z55_005081 [Caenorhabditis nigoni]|uniref:Glycosyltransferase family 92 protein n=1 Tax=Caenorhabditis nigoni TaxID=1611254 RepID=A0A2G5UZA7_9PELO|nr:hypothetical protein B9Z55_005081 [Caenorhabditis nigoni]